MKKQLSILLASLLMTIATTGFSQKASDSQSVSFYNGSYDNFLREVKKQKKIAIIDFWASWCAPCKKMDKETFTNKQLASHLNQNYLIYKVNIDTFDGMEIANRFAVESFPSLIILSEKGKLLDEWKGFFPANYLIERLPTSTPKNKSNLAIL